MINPFIICNVAEQAVAQQYAATERWEYECQALGATLQQCRAYSIDAWRYATTTMYPNDRIINYARYVAIEALKRGESMPTSAEAAIEAAEMRGLAACELGNVAPNVAQPETDTPATAS